jgi:TPR repeat protein
MALYTGEDVQRDPKLAAKYFHMVAKLHVGAAYMLGGGLLDGVGVERNRAAALVWLRNCGIEVALAILEAEGPDSWKVRL